MKTALAIPIALAAACGENVAGPPMPTIVLHVEPGVIQPDRLLEGARYWEAAGFEVRLFDGAYGWQCTRAWHVGNATCEISILVTDDLPMTEPAWGHALREFREVAIRSDIREERRARTMAHEVGHIILDVGNDGHLADGAGIMSVEGFYLHDELSGADLDLADRELAP